MSASSISDTPFIAVYVHRKEGRHVCPGRVLNRMSLLFGCVCLVFLPQTASETATVEDACTLIYHHLGIDLAVRSPSRFRCEFRQERFPPASPTQGASVAGGPPGLYPLDPQTRLIDLSVSSIHRPIVVELITQTPQDREGVSELFRAFEKARNPLVSWIFPQSRLSFELWIYTGTKRFGVRDLSPLGESKAKTVVTLLIENPVSRSLQAGGKWEELCRRRKRLEQTDISRGLEKSPAADSRLFPRYTGRERNLPVASRKRVLQNVHTYICLGTQTTDRETDR